MQVWRWHSLAFVGAFVAVLWTYFKIVSMGLHRQFGPVNWIFALLLLFVFSIPFDLLLGTEDPFLFAPEIGFFLALCLGAGLCLKWVMTR